LGDGPQFGCRASSSTGSNGSNSQCSWQVTDRHDSSYSTRPLRGQTPWKGHGAQKKHVSRYELGWCSVVQLVSIPPLSCSRRLTWAFSSRSEGEVQKGDTSVAAGLQIVCTTCYIKGTATAQLAIDGSFNASQAFEETLDQVQGEVQNITSAAVNNIQGVATNFTDGLDFEDFDFPTIPLDFNIDIPDIPECRLRFQFDGMELYMLLDTILSAGTTYTLNLYSSISPIGLAVGDELQVGVIFSVDLILSVEAEIDISSGFHIKLEDGIAIDIPMFDQNVSSITL
jgi:hypothetical protein